MNIPPSTSYLTIEIINDSIENNERVVHIKKICIGNPVEQFITYEVLRGQPRAKVRARNTKGHYIKDDPTTPENEAWITPPDAPTIPKPKKKRKSRAKKIQ